MKFNIEILRPSKASVDPKSFICKISFINKLDQGSCDEFEFLLMTLVQGGLKKVLYDMDELRYVDSSGIGKIINTTKHIRTIEGNVAIARCAPNVMEVFKLVHMEKFINIFGSNEEAISYLKLS